MGDLIERIENARSDADYYATRGEDDMSGVTLSRADCTEIGRILTEAFGAILMGKRDPELAEKIAIIAGAFEGEGDE